MVHLVESLRRSAILLKPFLTKTPDKIFEQLNIDTSNLNLGRASKHLEPFRKAQMSLRKGNPFFRDLDMEEEITFIKTKMQGNQSC